MNRTSKAIRKCAVAASLATAFLASALLSSGFSIAEGPQQQDAPKAGQKAEVPPPPAAPAPAPPQALAPFITIEVNTQVVEKVEQVKKVEVKKVEVGKVMVEPATKTTVIAPAAKIEAGAVGMIRLAQPAMKVARPAGELNPDAERAMVRQFVQQFQPILKSELRLLTSSSEPTPALRREIAMDGGKALKKAASEMAAIQQGMNVGRGINAIPDPRQLIREAVEAAAKAKLTPDQFGRYKQEQDDKSKDEREAVLMNIVANLDKAVILSSQQRDKLCDSVRANWDDRNYPTIETVTLYEGYFPMIPNQVLSPILSNEQMEIWKGVQKIQFSSIRNYTFINNQQVVADDGEDEDLKAAIAEEVKKP